MTKFSCHMLFFPKVLAVCVAISSVSTIVGAASPAVDVDAYRAFVREFWPVAQAQGISRELYDEAFRGLTPDPKVIERNIRQPEVFMPASQYLAIHVTDARVREGREKLRLYDTELDAMERRYGVDRSVVVAIWGMETSFGALRGKRNVIRSLSTLGYRGRRSKFGRTQLLAALKILKAGDIGLGTMTGSWAGAMGHTQFIPTSYLAYAVDFTGDGRRDIWETPVDALASTANYLMKSGWQRGTGWGYEVRLPKGFNAGLEGRERGRTIDQWRSLGVKRADGQKFPRPDDSAYLHLPAGAEGPAFLVLRNFRAIMRYNSSEKYALAVGHLADRIRGAPGFYQAWPDGIRPISKDEIKEVQRLLAARGYLLGEIDGLLGSKTRAAVRDVQRKHGLEPDGFPRPRLLEILRTDSAANR